MDQYWEEKLQDWERDVQNYETAASRVLDDQIKMAIILKFAPGPLKSHLQIDATSPTTTLSTLPTVAVHLLREHRTRLKFLPILGFL